MTPLLRYCCYTLLWWRLFGMAVWERVRYGNRSEFAFKGRLVSMTEAAWLIAEARFPK